jgi:hypothetical protein
LSQKDTEKCDKKENYNRRGINMKEIIDDIEYALFLDDMEFIDNEVGRKNHEEHKKMAMQEHCGDCTWDSCPCERCHYERRFNTAKTILRILYDRGWTQGGKVKEEAK